MDGGVWARLSPIGQQLSQIDHKDYRNTSSFVCHPFRYVSLSVAWLTGRRPLVVTFYYPMHTTTERVLPMSWPDRAVERVAALLETHLTGAHWPLNVLLYSLTLVFVTTTPFFNLHYFGAPDSSWDTLLQQASALLVPYRGVPGSHDANKVFRLAIPAFIKLFNLTAMQVFIGQVMCGVLILWVMIRITFAILQDKVSTVLFMTSFATCYCSYSAFYDVFGRIDAFGYLFILLSVYVRKPALVFLFCFLTAWSDERGLINTFFTAVYWLYADTGRPTVTENRLLTFAGLRANKQVLTVLASWMSYFFIRWILAHYYGFQTETGGVGASQFSITRQFIPLAVFSTYGLVWGILLIAFALVIARRDWLMAGLLALGMTVNFAVVVMIADINRSLAYSLPLVVISLALLGQNLPGHHVRKYLFVLAVFSLMIPIYDFDSHLHYHPTLPVRLVSLLAGVA